MNDKIFKLNYNNSSFYVPLWSNELIFEDLSGNDITIKCIAEIPENLHIDENNILHVNIRKDIKE